MVAVLFVGLGRTASGRETVAARLAELGAVRGRFSAPPPWSADGRSVIVFREADWPGLHLVLGGNGADCPIGPATSIDQIWADRIIPFEANLRSGRRAPRRLTPVLVPPDPAWAGQAERLISRIRYSAAGEIIRIDHIGSTSVPGLPAKQLIDIQVVVPGLAAAARTAAAARRAGFVHVPGRWSGTDSNGADHPEEVVVDADPGRPVNVNIRPVTAPVWRETLLLRDWLRSHDDERDAYAAMKLRLASRPGGDVDRYGEDKLPWISSALGRARSWSARTGWSCE